MTQARYEIWYASDTGQRIAPINDVISFEYVEVLGDVGYFALYLPDNGQVYAESLPDRRIGFYRRQVGESLSLDFLGLTREYVTRTTVQGQNQIQISGFHVNHILARRIIAYYANETQSSKTDFADDMMKEIVTENFISNADYSGTPDPTRSISSYLSVQADLSAGPSITKGFAWRNCLTVLQDIQAASKKAGTETFFGIVPLDLDSLEFRTWTSGADRTVSSGSNPLVFSLEWGNLDSPVLAESWADEANYIYAGGAGEEAARTVGTASDTTRINQSAINRVESFAYSNGNTEAQVTDDAEDELERKRPAVKFTANILDTPLTPYGGIQGWHIGDKVTTNYAGRQFDTLIRARKTQVDVTGNERITARVEVV